MPQIIAGGYAREKECLKSWQPVHGSRFGRSLGGQQAIKDRYNKRFCHKRETIGTTLEMRK